MRASKAWMRTSAEFKANPIGVPVDPSRVAELLVSGDELAEIHRRAMDGELAPEQSPALPGA